jgi:hypothetical protein
MAHIGRPLDIDLALRSGENRLDIPRVPFRRFTGAAVRVDEDLDALIALRLAVGAIEEARDPGRGEGVGGAGGGVEGVVYVGDTDGRFGRGLRVVDGEVDLGQGGPEDVEEGNCTGGFGFWCRKEGISTYSGACGQAVVTTKAETNGRDVLEGIRPQQCMCDASRSPSSDSRG